MLTVVIPTRNHSEYISKLIENLISYPDLVTEILICNDASTDNTEAILNQYSHIKILKIFKNEINIGAIASVCLMYEFVKNEYLIFLSSDDYFFPNEMLSLLHKMKEKNANLGFGKYKIQSQGVNTSFDHPGWRNLSIVSNNFINLFISDLYIFFGTAIFKKNAIDKVAKNKKPFEREFDNLVKFDGLGEFRAHDWNLALEIALLDNDKIIYLDKEIGVFRKVDNQLSSDDKYLHTGRAAFEMALLIHKFYKIENARKILTENSSLNEKVKNLLISKIAQMKDKYKQSDAFKGMYLPIIKSALVLMD
jgi:glycosyltransferase involved in cell wall biosynthesis